MGADDLARRVAEMGAAKRKAEVDAIVAARCAPLVEALERIKRHAVDLGAEWARDLATQALSTEGRRGDRSP